jgi:hypothetical protein
VAINVRINRENENNWIDFVWDAWPTNQVSLWIPEVWGFAHDQDRLWVRESVGWKQEGHDLHVGPCRESHRSLEFTWEARLAVGDDVVRIDLQVTNSGDAELPAMFNINGCLNFLQAPDFMDSTGQFTYVRTRAGWQDMATIRRPQSLNLGGDPYHLLVEGRDDPMDDQRLPDVYVTSSLCARIGRTGESCIGWAWDAPLRLDINFNRLQCMHSVPALGPLSVGRCVHRTGRIYFHRGDKDGLLDFCRRDGLV